MLAVATRFRSSLGLAGLAWVLCAGGPARAQEVPELEPFIPPVGGAWEPVRSLGQPPRWKFSVGAGYGLDRTLEPSGFGPMLSAAVLRDVLSPLYGALALGGRLYAGQRGEHLDGGFQFSLESPAIFLHTGLDWNARLGGTHWFWGASVPPRRGGLFARGGELRLDHVPGRSHSVAVSATLPVRQPLAGRTRPRRVDVVMPTRPSGAEPSARPSTAQVTEALGALSASMASLVAVANFFWLIEDESLGHDASVRAWQATMERFGASLDALPGSAAEGGFYERLVLDYHDTLERAFGLALGAQGGRAAALGRPLADEARRAALEEVVLPYNRLVGQFKRPDQLLGLLPRARARWLARVRLEPPPGASDAALAEALSVLDGWLGELEAVRRRIHGFTGDTRWHWLPMALVLRPEAHRTQQQVDDLVELALGRGFLGGNAVLSINAPQFQLELARSLLETERYHVLWIHDYRGRDAEGAPDRTAFRLTTEGYLRALLEAVRGYDASGRMPVFLLLVDQHFYELNDGRRWLSLLERPLSHRLSLGREFAPMERAVAALQDSLRQAVRASERLAAEMRSFGPAWPEQVVKVHVNVTNPADLSFRSRRLLGWPVGADNLLRDHRKIVLRDVFEDDPGAGELILAGVGVGDHYATATWDDRALIVQGPGAAAALEELRAVLARHRLSGDWVPAPLRPRPPAPDHASRIEALEASGATARVLQVHNRTGWGPKDASFVQMLLYDLAPAGTLLYVPDSMWTSYQWMAQLVSAAMRGCHVYVVAPALGNAPTTAFPLMSVVQELVTRLVVVEAALGERIREGGGDLRIGLFTRETPLDDVTGFVAEMARTFAENEFLRQALPLAPGVWERLEGAAASGGSAEAVREPASGLLWEGWSPAADAVGRTPKMHRKTQWLLSLEALRAVAAAEQAADLLAEAFASRAEALVSAPELGPLREQRRVRALGELLDVLEAEGRGPPPGVLYYATGSLNKSVRSLALDGEAIGIVAGPWAVHAFVDLVTLTGGVTWLRSLEEVEAHLPPYSPLQRRIGRWLRHVL